MTLFNDEKPSEREELTRKVRSLLKIEHLRRYGTDAVDERWMSALSDDAMRAILKAHDYSNPGHVY